MKWTKLLSIILLVAVAIPYSASADGRGRSKKIMKQLELTKEQKEKLKELRAKRKENTSKMSKGELKKLRGKMSTAFINGAPDSTLTELNSKIKDIMTSKLDRKFKRMLDIKKILTKEQRQKFIDLKKNKRKKDRASD